MIASLQFPRTIFGAGALSQLASELAILGVARPLVVTDAGIVRLGLVDKLNAGLPAGMKPVLFDGVTENPLFADADRGAAVYAAHGCDGVVALGGGSAIDTAKYIALLATNGGTVADYAGKHAPHRRCVALTAIPTTAGTGSEASPDAGIHPDAYTASTGLSSPAIIPHLAILDPALTVSLPGRLTAATGIDAISHCIEGYFSRFASPLTDVLALDGIRRAAGAIHQVALHGDDIAARGDMMLAAYAGGVAIGRGLGPAHAIAIACGDQGFQHGILSGIGLVCTLDLMRNHAPDRAAAVADALQAADGESLSAFVAMTMRSLGLPATLQELGYQASDLGLLSAHAHASPFNLSARHHLAAEAYAEMLTRSLDGRVG